MSGLISTLPRRLGLSTCAALAVLACSVVHLRWAVEQRADVTDEQLLKFLVVGPLVVGLFLLSVLSLLNKPPRLGPSLPQANREPMGPRGDALPSPTLVQVLGLQWLSPVHRGDYPTQWHLLWSQGLVGPNPEDSRLAEDDKAFDKVDVCKPMVSEGVQPIEAFGHYLDKLLDQLRDDYHSDAGAVYNACAPQPELRRVLDGIFISCALPGGIDVVDARELVGERVADVFGLAKARPVVHVYAGGAEAGVAALKVVHDYLRSFPQQSAWLLSWDAPELPTPAVSENLVLTVVAGTAFDCGRRPLAWLGAAATATPSAEPSEDSAALDDRGGDMSWDAALQGAAANADAERFSHVVYHATNSVDGVAGLVQALTQSQPNLSIHRAGFDVSQAFGAAGACTAPLSLALAVARVAHLGSSAAVVVALPDKQGVTAVAIKAPSDEKLPLKGPWFRADTEAYAYMPWWGRRLASSCRQSVLGLPT